VTLLALDARSGAAIGIAAGLAVFGGLLVITAMGELRGKRKTKVPPAFRPAAGDEELETRTLVRYLQVGAIATIVMALWLPAYWFREPNREEDKRVAFEALAVKQGDELFKQFCVSCHGEAGAGGVRQFAISGVSHTYAEPPLRYIYSRYELAGRNDDDITQLIRDAISRGRPGTPMPTWSIAFGGPLNSAQQDDLVAYLQSIQEKFPEATSTDGKELFAQNCAVCHGDNATGGIGPNLTVELQRLTEQEVFDTIKKGRLNINRPSMPAWAGLGDDAIHALVRFLQSIQRG
jgi:mono/diheme cytochrome c family protein